MMVAPTSITAVPSDRMALIRGVANNTPASFAATAGAMIADMQQETTVLRATKRIATVSSCCCQLQNISILFFLIPDVYRAEAIDSSLCSIRWYAAVYSK
jgi:hypothetical protein